jgi:hypothetical protein
MAGEKQIEADFEKLGIHGKDAEAIRRILLENQRRAEQ